MRKPKTPLLSFLQKCLRKASLTEKYGEHYSDALEEKRNAERYDRREFILRSAGAMAAGGALLSFTRDAHAATVPRIAIIGGGIAGLNAAYQLNRLKINNRLQMIVTVYEGSSEQFWGRIQTKKIGNLTADIGGEFIDSGHGDMLKLVKELGLGDLTDNELQSPTTFQQDAYFFGGRHYTVDDVKRELKEPLRKIKRDNSLYEREIEKEVKRLDETSIEQYFEGLGLKESWVYDFLKAAYTSEFGLAIGEQSALNFITMIGTDPAAGFKIFGDSDERFRIKGGAGELIEKLKGALVGQIQNERKLTALRRSRTGTYKLIFERGGEVDADILVMALPFNQLRNVEIEKNLFTKPKMTAINELGYGTSSKLILPTRSRVWRQQNYSGYLFNETVQNGWDFTLGQNGNYGKGGYTVFLGGEAGRTLERDDSRKYINEIDRAFRGFEKTVDDRHVYNWSKGDLAPGGYACYKTGQWTTISGEEIKPEQRDTVFFCGEHCSSDYQGYMNGGAETGRNAAERIIKKLKPTVRPKKRDR